MTWETVPLSGLIRDVAVGFASSDDLDDGVFQIRMNNLTRESGWDWSRRRRVLPTPRQLEVASVRAGDVIFNATNSPELVGKSGRMPVIDEPAVISNHFMRLRPSVDLDSGYLSQWLRSQFQRGVFRARAKAWINQATVSREALLSLRIPLPPLPEQRRIAAILDEADALRFKMMASDRLVENLESSTFDALVRRVNRRRVRLSDVARTTSGGTPSRAQTGNYAGPIPWVKSGEVGQGLVMSTSETITEMALKRSSAKVMPIGTVLVAMYGATAGEVGVLGIEAATNQAVCAITPGLGLDSGFLRRALLGMKPHLKSKAVGGAQPNLSQGMIRDIELDLPSLEQQHEIAQKCDEISRLRSHRAECALNDALFASLQHRAFRGEL